MPRQKGQALANKVKILDEKYLGTLPFIEAPVESNSIELGKAFNYYNYFYDSKDAKPWIVEYMKKNKFSKEKISVFEKIEPYKYTLITMGAIAHMHNRGSFIPEDMISRFNKKIEGIIEHWVGSQEVTTSSGNPIQDRILERVSDIVATIDEQIDRFSKSDFSAYKYLSEKEVKPAIAKRVAEYYAPLKAELNDSVLSKEGHAYMPKKMLEQYREFINTIVSDIDRYCGNQKQVVVRKPRAKKVKTAVQLVKYVKYQKQDQELKLTSIDPAHIIGAQSLWLYNTKYKSLTVLYAKNSSGLSVNGTTVTDFDTTSVTKTLRKPEITLKKVLDGGKVILKNIMGELTTKPVTAVGRLNDNMIILRAVK